MMETEDRVEFEAGPLTFRQWMAEVDSELNRIIGLGHMDIADWDYRCAFEDGTEPATAAREALLAELDAPLSPLAAAVLGEDVDT